MRIRNTGIIEEEIMMTELQELLDAVNGEIYGVWFLIGAALVFWMQAGFAMVDRKSVV